MLAVRRARRDSNSWVALPEFLCNLQSRIVRITGTNDDLKVGIILLEEALKVLGQAWFRAVYWLEHSYRRQRRFGCGVNHQLGCSSNAAVTQSGHKHHP